MYGAGPPAGRLLALGMPNSCGMQNFNATKRCNQREYAGERERKRMRMSAKKSWSLGQGHEEHMY